MFVAAYWDLGRFLRAHWFLGLLTAVILFAAFLARAHLPRLLGGNATSYLMWRHGIDVAAIVLTAPFLLAIHRFILLGEVRDRYVFELHAKRFQSFGGWLVVAMLAASIPSLVFFAYRSSGPIYYTGQAPAADIAPLFALGIACVIVLVIFLRMILLFPAIAVDAPEPSWQNAFEETQGAPWFAGFACVLPLVPIVLAGIVVVAMTRGVPLVSHAVWAALVLSAFTLLAAVASRLYQILGRPVANVSH